ncbi:hypothetical protein ACTA71_012313 [Dictyostelium dimigraforme]
MKFIATFIIFVFTMVALTNTASVYSGFTVSSSDNSCSKSIAQTEINSCVNICNKGFIKIEPEQGKVNTYTITGYADQCQNSLGSQTLVCGTPVTLLGYSMDCTPVTDPTSTTGTSTTTGTSSTIVISFGLILASLLIVLAL